MLLVDSVVTISGLGFCNARGVRVQATAVVVVGPTVESLVMVPETVVTVRTVFVLVILVLPLEQPALLYISCVVVVVVVVWLVAPS